MLAHKRKSNPKTTLFPLRMTAAFRKELEHAAAKGGFPTLAEFVRAAIIREAERHGAKFIHFR